jgi:hypothetical protein
VDDDDVLLERRPHEEQGGHGQDDHGQDQTGEPEPLAEEVRLPLADGLALSFRFLMLALE